MSNLEYVNIAAYRVTWRLHGKPLEECFSDTMAEYLRCAGCGAPKGYFCLSNLAEDEITPIYPTRMTCRGVIGSQNPRTTLAFAKYAKQIQEPEAEERKAKR